MRLAAPATNVLRRNRRRVSSFNLVMETVSVAVHVSQNHSERFHVDGTILILTNCSCLWTADKDIFFDKIDSPNPVRHWVCCPTDGTYTGESRERLDKRLLIDIPTTSKLTCRNESQRNCGQVERIDRKLFSLYHRSNIDNQKENNRKRYNYACYPQCFFASRHRLYSFCSSPGNRCPYSLIEIIHNHSRGVVINDNQCGNERRGFVGGWN